MSSQITTKLIAALFWGNCLALISHNQPAPAQMSNHQVLLAQQTVIETLPPLPDVPVVFDSQQPLPQVQPNALIYPTIENQEPLLYQPNQPNQYSQNFQRYSVYVDRGDYQTLQRVRKIEPRAYIREYQGRYVIQSGVFSRQANAEQRVRELASYGISGARVVGYSNGYSNSYSNGREIQTYNPTTNSQPKNYRYYVIIPGKTQDLPAISDKIARNVGNYNLIQERQKPFGPHVAVGPFATREEAERWNKYMQQLKFGNARVYYSR